MTTSVFMQEQHFGYEAWRTVKDLVENKNWRVVDICLFPPKARDMNLPPTQQAERFQKAAT